MSQVVEQVHNRRKDMAWRADVNQNISTIISRVHSAYIILSNESKGPGYHVFRFNSNDEVLFGDDFYFSLEEAKFHCKEDYQVDEDAWYEYPAPDWRSIKAASDQ